MTNKDIQKLHEDFTNSLPSVTEDEIADFDYPILIDCGRNPEIDAIIHALNNRNQNEYGYGNCPRCNGYHGYTYGDCTFLNKQNTVKI